MIYLYTADFSKKLRIDFELLGASYIFVRSEDPEMYASRLHLTGGSAKRRANDDRDELTYNVSFDDNVDFIVVSPHIWAVALDDDPPVEPRMRVTVKQSGTPLKPYVPSGIDTSIVVTELKVGGKQPLFSVPDLLISKIKMN